MNIIIGILFLFVIQRVNSQSDPDPDLLIGQACMTGGQEGRCTPWRKCLTLAIDKQNGVKLPVCSYNGTEPIICCTSCHLVEDVSKAVIGRTGGIFWKTSQKSWNKCVSYMRELPYACADGLVTVEKEWSYANKCHCAINRYWIPILNGNPAVRSEYPHLALLGFGEDANNVTEWVCTGTVISERYILTAGHCMATKTRLPVVMAALGILKRSDPEELWQKYRILRRLPHPEYRPPYKYHDIALLQTEKTIQFNRNVLPACLPATPEQNTVQELVMDFTGRCYNGIQRSSFFNLTYPSENTGFEDHPYADAVGWGATGHREALSDVLQYVNLEHYNLTECSRYYGPHRHMPFGLQDTQLCYGHSAAGEMRDTCDGDSGGPLHIAGRIMYCQYVVIGVTSFGVQCGLKQQPGVYTRVQHYVPWIESEIWPEG